MKTKVPLTTKLRNSFRELDMFGHDFKFNLRGEETINSTYGAWFSLAIYLTLVVYAMIRWNVFYFKQGTLNAEIIVKDLLDTNYRFYLEENNFQMAFGVRSYYGQVPRDDPEYVEYVV
jgi:hypothetical protein